MWTTGSGTVGRVGEQGTEIVARREVALSAWLNEHGVRTVRVIRGVTQPTVVDGYPVTWWEQLPKHRPATPGELGGVLREIHKLPIPPDIDLPPLEPLSDLQERLSNVTSTTADDAAWLLARVKELESRYPQAISGLPTGLVNGDAWQENVAVTDDRNKIVLDLESFCTGPQYWDLIPMAVDHTDFNRISASEYGDFVAAYGFDVTHTRDYRTLADMQELRWITYVVDKAEHNPAAAKQAAHRISCVKGRIPKPWTWDAF